MRYFTALLLLAMLVPTTGCDEEKPGDSDAAVDGDARVDAAVPNCEVDSLDPEALLQAGLAWADRCHPLRAYELIELSARKAARG